MRFIPVRYYLLALVIGLLVALAPEPSPEGGLVAGSTPSKLMMIASPKSAEAATVTTAAPMRSPAAAYTESALEVLYSQVQQQSHPEALRAAFEAYYNFREAHPDQVRKPYLYFVDFGLAATEPRGYVFDMDALSIVEGPFTVAHGRGSAPGASAVPTRFSNRPGSAATSLGLFLTTNTYGFTGHSGGRAYRSIGLRLEGLSGSFNSAAMRRGVVIHGAPYVTETRAGRSEGCPAMEPARAQRLLPKLGNGALVFLFSPNDGEWLRSEPWIREDLASVTSVIPNS